MSREPVVHRLKLVRTYFDDALLGRKSFEVRIDDRFPRYEEGDALIIAEWDEKFKRHTGRKFIAGMGYLLRGMSAWAFGVQEGYCVFAIKAPNSDQMAMAIAEEKNT